MVTSPSPIEYRRATAADQPAINRLIREAGINPMGLKWPRFVLAVEAGTGRLVATGQIKTHGDGSRELASIATDPAYQRRGIASVIIRELIAQDARESDQPLYLTCVNHNGPFYERFGFRRIGPAEMPRYFRRLQGLARVMEWMSRGQRALWVMQLDKPGAKAPSP